MTNRSVSELAVVAFDGSLEKVFADYASRVEELARRLAFELAVAAGDSEAAMGRMRDHPLLFGLDCRLRARRVSKRLKRGVELAEGLNVEARLLYHEYCKQFLRR